MPRGGEQRAHRGAFGDPAAVHHRDPVDPAGDHSEVVGDQDQRHAEAGAQLVDEFEDLVLCGDVEGGGRFVGDQQPGFADQCHGDRHALPHPSAELVGVVRQSFGGTRHADQPQGLLGSVPGLGLGQPPVQQQGFGDLGAYGEGGVEGGQRVLEDHADGVSADLSQGGFRGGGEVGAPEQDPAFGDPAAGRQQAEDGQRRHGLAAAGFADDAERLPRGEVQVDAVKGPDGAAAAGDVDMQVLDP